MNSAERKQKREEIAADFLRSQAYFWRRECCLRCGELDRAEMWDKQAKALRHRMRATQQELDEAEKDAALNEEINAERREKYRVQKSRTRYLAKEGRLLAEAI